LADLGTERWQQIGPLGKTLASRLFHVERRLTCLLA